MEVSNTLDKEIIMNTQTKQYDNESIPQTRDEVSYIDEITKIMEKIDFWDDCTQEEGQMEAQAMPLSVCVMSLHPTPVGEEMRPDHYEILLGTGGPAYRIFGELDQYCQVDNVQLQFQDWGTPWTSLNHLLSNNELKTLLQFAQTFYFGE
jgi:hypothetical protein